jgi:predicted phosphodiesterase
MAVKILHLSDIHFCCPKNDGFDIDDDLRKEIEFDLDNLVEKFGSVDLILIGGDIAFSGTVDEFDKADKWLRSITTKINCPIENVLTVPGNHDVNRNDIGGMCSEAQLKFKKQTDRPNLDSLLKRYSEDKQSLGVLLQHLNNYQDFAVKYGVVYDETNQLYWQKDVPVGPYVMRIRGVNSAIASNSTDNGKDSLLFLGSMQSTLSREAGMFYLFLCHHPPDWLIDGTSVDTDLNARARIQLFGHKHTFKVEVEQGCLRLSAGAVHPSRKELNWEPRYNVLEIEANEGKVNVNVWKRVWDDGTKKFKADHPSHVEYDTHVLYLDDVEKRVLNIKNDAKPITTSSENEETMSESEIETIDPHKPSPLRKLGFFFLKLPYSEKTTIAISLSLLEEKDKAMNEVERSKAYFARAKEQNLLHDLWEHVASKYLDGTLGDNPF